MKHIRDFNAFQDAQLMALAAAGCVEKWWRDAYWNAAMLALKQAYEVK